MCIPTSSYYLEELPRSLLHSWPIDSLKVAQTHIVISNSRETVLKAFASAAEAPELESQAGHDHQLQYT